MKKHQTMIQISHNSKYSNYTKNEFVHPIKKYSDRMKFKHYWLSNSYHGHMGRRNWTLFRVGIVTALRASDLVRLQNWQVYYKSGIPRPMVIDEIDKKTGKANHYLDIKQIHDSLVVYHIWRKHYGIISKWLFPQYRNKSKHITPNYLYMLMSKTADRLGIKHIGSHSLRKTFGYLAMKQTGNIGYVMKRLNQSNPKVTLRYIGLDKANMNQITDQINLQ